MNQEELAAAVRKAEEYAREQEKGFISKFRPKTRTERFGPVDGPLRVGYRPEEDMCKILGDDLHRYYTQNLWKPTITQTHAREPRVENFLAGVIDLSAGPDGKYPIDKHFEWTTKSLEGTDALKYASRKYRETIMDCTIPEEWRFCPGMNTRYQVSNYGRVRSRDSRHKMITKRIKVWRSSFDLSYLRPDLQEMALANPNFMRHKDKKFQGQDSGGYWDEVMVKDYNWKLRSPKRMGKLLKYEVIWSYAAANDPAMTWVRMIHGIPSIWEDVGGNDLKKVICARFLSWLTFRDYDFMSERKIRDERAAAGQETDDPVRYVYIPRTNLAENWWETRVFMCYPADKTESRIQLRVDRDGATDIDTRDAHVRKILELRKYRGFSLEQYVRESDITESSSSVRRWVQEADDKIRVSLLQEKEAHALKLIDLKAELKAMLQSGMDLQDVTNILMERLPAKEVLLFLKHDQMICYEGFEHSLITFAAAEGIPLLTKNKQERKEKLQRVLNMVKEGASISELQEMFSVSKQTVHSWIREAKEMEAEKEDVLQADWSMGFEKGDKAAEMEERITENTRYDCDEEEEWDMV